MHPQLVITRPMPGAADFAQAVEAAFGRSLTIIISPALRIEPLDFDVPEGINHIIFTSANGVRAAVEKGLSPLTAWCVGDRTAAMAEAAGYDARSASGDAAALVDLIIAANPSGKLLHIAGQHTRGDIAGRLRAAGLSCETVTAYTQVPQPPSASLRAALQGETPLVFPLFSPLSTGIIRGEKRSVPVHVIAMSQAVADEIGNTDADEIVVAAEPTQQAMIAATVKVLKELDAEAG